MTQSEYRDALRAFVKDHDYLNRLLNFTQENTDDEMDLYLFMALGFANLMPPFVGDLTLEQFPIPTLIIHQATIECLISNGIVNTRNELTYNNGGITVKIPDGDKYLKWIQQLFRVTDRMLELWRQQKIRINIEGGFGGVHSPYARLHGRGSTLQPNTILSG